ncbi:hypothetical protein CCACVL1_00103, partial [Corchorus capsularis]
AAAATVDASIPRKFLSFFYELS